MPNIAPRHALTLRTSTLVTTLATVLAASAIAMLAGCGKRDAAVSVSNPVAGKIAVVPATPDTTRPASEAGLPRGYHAVFDDTTVSATGVTYAEKQPGRFEVTTGPAHILYSPADTARNRFTASATFEQLEAPAHPEAFGVFIGGSNLKTAAARYTYFLVRGDGMFAVKVRDGAKTRTITDWTVQPSIPKQDAAGRALFGVRIQVSGGTANVSVNGVPITSITAKNAPLNGIAGVRINHNLHLIVTPVSLIR
ncbi:MAG: hypothetical protein M3R65_00595 [Gemmatimonadota bacterium]|nr:hypothetical protein [Gemmatimonadota bacterium]